MSYTEANIKSLDWREHIRLRPGMYIGKLGDGSLPEDGIYVLIKEVIDNCIDEYAMGYGDKIEIKIDNNIVSIRDYGRGIPLGKLKDCCAKINTGAKYDSESFKKSVGLNGVGIKAVNALSSKFEVTSFRDNQYRKILFEKGLIKNDNTESKEGLINGTRIKFIADKSLFLNYSYNLEYIREMLRFYSWLNPGLSIYLNEEVYLSDKGLVDLINYKLFEQPLYPLITLKCTDVELSFSHSTNHGEECYSFVNGQNTTQGGTHLNSFREAIVQCCRSFFNKQFDPQDVRNGIIVAISTKIQEPVFESQTKTKLGSLLMEPNGRNLKSYISNSVIKELDNYLHRNKNIANAILTKILANEKERKEVLGIQKASKDAAKKVKVFNKSLRDCRIHLDSKDKRKDESCLFITEGDSAAGSITKSRDASVQAVFSLRGKPLNCFGLTKKIVYENEELYLLTSALNIEQCEDDLKYNKIIIATDADVDGMHIRLLMMTFFLQFFPNLIKNGHVFILKTPLFRVRNKYKTFYCYTDEERISAIEECGSKQAEITRFKGLGEISPDEFKNFIGPKMRLEPILMPEEKSIKDILTFYMGKNTLDRQKYIIENLRNQN